MKGLLVLVMLVLLASSVFAVTSNSIQKFSLSYGECPSFPFLGNSSSKCLLINSTCNAQAIATLTLTGNRTREVICSSWDIGESWSLGDLGSTTQITGTLTIPSPCETCSRTSTVNINELESTQGIAPAWIFIIILIIILITFGWIFGFLFNQPRY